MSWLDLYLGLIVFRFAIRHRTALPKVVPVALMILPLVDVDPGFIAGALDVFTLAGTLQITTGATLAMVVYGLWTARKHMRQSRRPPDHQ